MDDNQKSLTRANRLKDGENQIQVNETSFLPSLEMMNREQNALVATVITNDGIDIAELNKFIEIALITEHRNKNFTVFEKVYNKVMANSMFGMGNNKKEDFKYENMKRILYPMRLCTKEDFTTRHYPVSDEFEDKLKYRVCPDIKKDDPHYKVKNLY